MDRRERMRERGGKKEKQIEERVEWERKREKRRREFSGKDRCYQKHPDSNFRELL